MEVAIDSYHNDGVAELPVARVCVWRVVVGSDGRRYVTVATMVFVYCVVVHTSEF